MDASRFDALARTLTDAHSRRGAVGGLLAGALGLLGMRAEEAEAHNPLKKCKKIDDKTKRKKCIKKAKKHNAQHAAEATVPPAPPPPVAPLACGAGGPCLVFLSSILYQGNLGGLSGADAKCQSMATAAGLPGTYKAWLSDATSSPASRFVRSTGPYRLVNGTTIAANWTDLTDGTLAAPINVTETGGGTGDVTYVWTNTDPDGTARNVPSDASKGHCTNWSTNSSPASDGIGGSAGSRTASWTALVIAPCDYRYHLYCFQQR